MNVDRTPAHIGIDKSTKICYAMIMLDSEGIGNPHNPRTVRRAGLVQRIGHSLGFEGRHVNPNLDMGYSRREKFVGRFVASSVVALTLLGINHAENRVQEHHDRNAAEHVDGNSNSGQ